MIRTTFKELTVEILLIAVLAVVALSSAALTVGTLLKFRDERERIDAQVTKLREKLEFATTCLHCQDRRYHVRHETRAQAEERSAKACIEKANEREKAEQAAG